MQSSVLVSVMDVWFRREVFGWGCVVSSYLMASLHLGIHVSVNGECLCLCTFIANITREGFPSPNTWVHILWKDFLRSPLFSSALLFGERLAPSGCGPSRQLSLILHMHPCQTDGQQTRAQCQGENKERLTGHHPVQ